jgi:hypothetical protein
MDHSMTETGFCHGLDRDSPEIGSVPNSMVRTSESEEAYSKEYALLRRVTGCITSIFNLKFFIPH